MANVEIKLVPGVDAKTVHGAYEIETNVHGVWEKRQTPVEFTSDDGAQTLSLGPYDRLIVPGGYDYEMVYDKEQNVSTIVAKTHEPPPPPPEPEPEPEADPTADPTTRRGKR